MQHTDDSFTFRSDGEGRWLVEAASSRWVTITVLDGGRCEIEPGFWLHRSAAVTVPATLQDVLGVLQELVTTERRAYAVLADLAARNDRPARNAGGLAQLVRGVALAAAGLVIAGLVIAALVTGQLA